MSQSLLTAAQQNQYKTALDSVFWTFARPFSLYIQAQTAYISTSPQFSRFGFHDQNVPVSATNPPLTPQVYTVTGCILYGKNQPWDFTAFDGGSNSQQLKLRDSEGKVRIKVEATGHALMQQVKTVVLDGWTFNLSSTPRPHGIVGQPDRWTYSLDKVD